MTKRNSAIALQVTLAAFCVVAVWWLPACSSDPTTMPEFVAWFSPERGYVKTKAVKYINYRVQYRPPELMMIGELDPQATYTQAELDELRGSYGESIYILLEISLDPEVMAGTHDALRLLSADYPDFAEKLKTLAFRLEDSVWLQVGEARVPPSVYHYERGFELGEQQRILFAFQPPSGARGGEATFVFDDPVFRTGLNRFHFDLDPGRIPRPPVRVG
jgi:hypothetical protein